MSNEDCYECGEVGPFWLIIQDNWDDQMKITINHGEWPACDDIFLPIETPLVEARKVAIDKCLDITHNWAFQVLEADPERQL